MDIQQSLAGQMSQNAIKEMLEVATGSRDGKVSFQDFKRIVLSGLKSESKESSTLNVAIAEMSMHPGRLSRVHIEDEDETPRSPKSPPPADKKAAPAAPADKKAAPADEKAAPAAPADKKAAPAAPADKKAAPADQKAAPADKKAAPAAPADKKAAPAAPADMKAAPAAPADMKAAPAAPAEKAGEPPLEKKEPTQYL